jgi:hypothetical protein
VRGAGRLRVDRRPVWESSNEAHRGELAGDEAMEGDDRALTKKDENWFESTVRGVGQRAGAGQDANVGEEAGGVKGYGGRCGC